jgi:ATP-dependent Clp protease adaptor protein ClpS
MNTKPDVIEKPLIQLDTDDDGHFNAKVILFNDNEHSFDEVIDQLILAINCSEEKAYLLTMQVHKSGFAVVFTNNYDQCLNVSCVLEEIQLKTKVEI